MIIYYDLLPNEDVEHVEINFQQTNMQTVAMQSTFRENNGKHLILSHLEYHSLRDIC